MNHKRIKPILYVSEQNICVGKPVSFIGKVQAGVEECKNLHMNGCSMEQPVQVHDSSTESDSDQHIWM